MALDSPLLADAPAEELRYSLDMLDEGEDGESSFFRILRAPEADPPEEPVDLPWELPSRLTAVELVPEPAGRPFDWLPVLRFGTRLPEPASLRSMTRLPLRGWTLSLAPAGRTFGA